MKKYIFTYWSNKEGWHSELLLKCKAIDIRIADAFFQFETAIDPKKTSWVSCTIEEDTK